MSMVLTHALLSCANGDASGPLHQWPALSMALESAGLKFPAEIPVEKLASTCRQVLDQTQTHSTS